MVLVGLPLSPLMSNIMGMRKSILLRKSIPTTMPCYIHYRLHCTHMPCYIHCTLHTALYPTLTTLCHTDRLLRGSSQSPVRPGFRQASRRQSCRTDEVAHRATTSFAVPQRGIRKKCFSSQEIMFTEVLKRLSLLSSRPRASAPRRAGPRGAGPRPPRAAPTSRRGGLAKIRQAESIMHNIAHPLYPHLNVGFGLESWRGDELTC